MLQQLIRFHTSSPNSSWWDTTVSFSQPNEIIWNIFLLTFAPGFPVGPRAPRPPRGPYRISNSEWKSHWTEVQQKENVNRRWICCLWTVSLYSWKFRPEKSKRGSDIWTEWIIEVEDACRAGAQRERLPSGLSVLWGLVFHPVPGKGKKKTSLGSQETLISLTWDIFPLCRRADKYVQRPDTCIKKQKKLSDCSFKRLPKGTWQLKLAAARAVWLLPAVYSSKRVLSIGDAGLPLSHRPRSPPQLPRFSALPSPSLEHGVTALPVSSCPVCGGVETILPRISGGDTPVIFQGLLKLTYLNLKSSPPTPPCSREPRGSCSGFLAFFSASCLPFKNKLQLHVMSGNLASYFLAKHTPEFTSECISMGIFSFVLLLVSSQAVLLSVQCCRCCTE